MHKYTEHYTTQSQDKQTNIDDTRTYTQNIFTKQVRKGLMPQEDIEMNLDMFIQGKNEEDRTKQ